MASNTSDLNRCIRNDFVCIQSEINIKSRRFRIPLDGKSQDLLDAYYKQVSSDIPSNDRDVSAIRDLKRSITASNDGDSFSGEVSLLLKFIMSKLPKS